MLLSDDCCAGIFCDDVPGKSNLETVRGDWGGKSKCLGDLGDFGVPFEW